MQKTMVTIYCLAYNHAKFLKTPGLCKILDRLVCYKQRHMVRPYAKTQNLI